MKKIIWGTGMYASKFVQTVDREEIAFYIDSDVKKRGKDFFGKKILHPDDVSDWKDLFVYIPVNFYDEIAAILKEHGVEETNYCKYYERNVISYEASERDFKRAIQELEDAKEKMQDQCIFCGYAFSIVRGYQEYVRQWLNKDKQLQMALVSEAVWLDKDETEKQTGVHAVIAPKIVDNDLYVRDGMLEPDEMCALESVPDWQDDVAYVQGDFQDISKESACYMIYRMYQYLQKVIELFRPRMMILHTSVSIQHKILTELCLERKIPFVYTHQGILPGTFAFDVGGEVGASLPAVYATQFKALPVSEEEKEQAKELWDYLYVTKMNRKVQPKNHVVEHIKEQLATDRPTIFYGGQNDIRSHMVPYTEEAREHHSPIFQSSIEAAVYIGEICRKNHWNFIYKPHPMYAEKEDVSLLTENTIYVKYGDINDLMDVSDVFVTILSTSNYVGLIRKKPVVMLGYTQSKGKDVTYEAFRKADIEPTIRAAVENGFTQSQKKAFIIHLAQVVKYYLYDDMRERERRFAKPIPQHIEELWDLERLLKQSKEEA
jgi:hypothetical protein